MSNLAYRGFKGSRARMGVALLLSFTALMLLRRYLGLTESELKLWTDFVLLVYATYGLSEVGAKGAEAYQTKGTPNGPAS